MVCAIWLVLIGTVLVLLLVMTVQKMDPSDDVTISMFRVVHCLSVACVFLCFFVTNFWPLNKTFQNGAIELRKNGKVHLEKSLNADASVLSSLKTVLDDETCRNCFKEFVQREFNS